MTALLQERRPRRERADNAARRRAQILDASIESIVRHGLRAALAAAPADPVARILALVRADFDPAVCNRRMLTLWHAFWGEATARPLFAEISEGFDRERAAALYQQCKTASDLLDASVWTPESLAVALDSLTDGLWIRMHLDPDGVENAEAMRITCCLVAAAFPRRAAAILAASA